MRYRGPLFGALLIAVPLLSGCGARVAPGEPNLEARTPSAPVLAESNSAASRASQPQPLSQSPPESPAGAGETPGAPSSPGFGPRHNNGVVLITLSASCVRPGGLLVVTLKVPPEAGLGMIIGYADNQPHGAMNTGEADGTGSYVWRVPVAPTVPDGQARVLVTSTGPNWEGEGGTADAVFTVARGGCG